MIASMELGTINVSHINRNRFLQLARLGKIMMHMTSPVLSLKKILFTYCFLVNHHQYLIDQLIEINDRILASIKRKGTRDSQEQLKEKGKLATKNWNIMLLLIDALHFAKDNDSNPFDEIETNHALGRFGTRWRRS